MSSESCESVGRYLDAFLDRGAREGVDLDRISAHVSGCASCYERFSTFFRTMELPESSYLRETLDDLALALYNLGKAIIRDRPPVNPDDVTENVVITEEGRDGIDENLEAGVETIEDAEDYTGSSVVEGADLEEVRRLLESAEDARRMRIDLALEIFRRVPPLGSRYTSEAWNWIGVLHCQKEEFEEAERAFMQVLRAPDGATNVRALTHCNLSYVFKARGEVDRAILSARRSVILAEEDGKDPYFGRFAEVYFLVLRGRSEDLDAAEKVLSTLCATREGLERLRNDLHLASNEPVLEALRKSPLAARFPDLLS